MTTSSYRLRETIVEVLTAAYPRAVELDEFYAAVERRVAFDADDLRPPNLRGNPVSEPSWKRNVRNVLQAAKREGTFVNLQHNAWRLPTGTESPLDESEAWPEVRRAALNALERGLESRSTQEDRRYRITDVDESRLTVQRLDSPGPATLTSGEVTRAVRFLNAAGGRLGRRAVNYTVAKEVAIVYLHPRLAWSADSEWIEVLGAQEAEPVTPNYRDFGEAPDDDPTQLARFARKVRAGQPKFRRNLMALYGKRCAISRLGTRGGSRGGAHPPSRHVRVEPHGQWNSPPQRSAHPFR